MCLTERFPRHLSHADSSAVPCSPSSSYKIRPSSLSAMSGLIPLALATPETDRRASFRLPARDARGGRLPAMGSSPPRTKPARPSPPRSARRMLPASPAAWTRTLDLVKGAYLSSKYDECSARCLEMLSLAAQHQHSVELAYLVYLRFYAATALDAQASLASSRHRRLALLQQAQVHYRAASLLAKQPSTPPVSRNSSPMPSLRSSVGSDLSWSPVSTRMSSPDPGFGWPEVVPGSPESPEPASVKAKKRVSFRDVPDVEPFVRPDSPTLGSEDWHALTPSRLFSPESILKQDKALSAMRLPLSSSPRLSRLIEVSDEPFVDACHYPRYDNLLGSIRRDLLARVAALDTDIANCQADPASKVEARSLDLKARIERLRENGWRRPRFDAQRYETLRESALADLAL